MAKEYFDKLTALFNQINSKKITNFEIKHFFNGAAVYFKGRICITLSPVGLAIKLPELSRNKLMKEGGVKPLRYFSKGHIKNEYVVLPKKMVSNKRLLAQLIRKSFEYVA
jgi:TfoX/Sxy family transcriptional regulator of competence genes